MLIFPLGTQLNSIMSHKKSRADSFVRCYNVGNPTKHPDGFTIYKVTQQLIQVNALEKNIQEVVTWKRYNDFKKLYKSMFSLHKALHRREEFPEFARAQLFNRFDVNVIEERRRSAQDLLNFVGQRHYLVASQPFKQFFADAQPVSAKPQTVDNLLKPLTAGNSNSDALEQNSDLSSCSADSAAANGLLVPVPAAECSPANLLDCLPAEHPSSPGSISPPFLSPDRSVSASPESHFGEHACDAAEATPTLGGIWLHRQLPEEDIGSLDEILDGDYAGSEEDHCDGITYPGITTTSHSVIGKCLDKSDIAAFDSLLSAPPSDNLAATSNLELLSMITADVTVETPVAMEIAAAVEMPVADFAVTDDVSSRIAAAIDDDQDPWSSGSASKTTKNSLSASFSAGDGARPRLGSIIESGRGDLTVSPVHHTAPPATSVGSSGSQIPALLRAGASLARSKLSLPWKSNSNGNLAGSSATNVCDAQAGYILEAAELISQAQEHETGGNFPAAYCHYRSGIEILVKGVQKDTNKERQHAVGMKMNKYLLKADELYQAHLAGSSGQEVWNRWGSECETEVDAGVALLRAPAASLKNLRVIGIISGVLLVVDTATEGTYVIKVLHKSCTDPAGSRSIIPTHIPYVVSLVRFYETDSAIYLLLQHAAGGRLWSYIGAYLNQCTEMSPDVLANPDCQPPLLSSPRQQTTGNTLTSGGTDCKASEKLRESSHATDNASQEVALSEEKDALSRLSLTEADDTIDPLEIDVATATSDPDFQSPGFGEMLRKTAQDVEFFSIDSGDSESLSRQVSSTSDFGRCDAVDIVTSSAVGLSDDPVVTGFRTTAMHGNTGDDGQSLNETSIYDSCRLYDQNSNSDSSVSEDLPPAKPDEDLDAESAAVQIHSKTTVSVSLSDLTPAASISSKDSPTRRPSMMLRLSSQDRSFETSGRRRHRTLSSAFGELDLASTNEVAISSTPRHPKVIHLPESCVRQWAAEMVVAISRLHSLGIICRDLRPANILLGDRGHILLTYFSRWNTVDWTLNEQAVDNLYCAPEVRNVQVVMPACDWWSLGALVYELLTGQTLRSCHPAGITSHTTLIVPSDISSEAQSLLQELLRFSPTERLGGGVGGADDIRAHPFFSGIIWNNLLG